MKVYVVINLEEETHEIQGVGSVTVFDNKEAAEEFNRFNCCWGVYECEVRSE